MQTMRLVEGYNPPSRLRPGSLTRDRPSTGAGLVGAIHASLRRRGAVGR